MQIKISPAHVTISVASSDVGAGYQIFGKWAWWMTDKSYLGRVWSRTDLPQTEKITQIVDTALERDKNEAPDSTWNNFYKLTITAVS